MDTDEFLRRLEELRQGEAARSEDSSRPYRLLPGEDPASPYPGDAQQWASVYGELIRFKEQVVRQFEAKQQEQLSQAAEAELDKDEQGLRAELERLRLHLRYWEERQQNVAPEGGSGGAP